MTRPNCTEVVFVVDRSGSMKSIAESMSAAFDAFIKKQALVPGECRVTVVQFDDRYEPMYTALPLNQVPPYSILPRGQTALLDALGKTIVVTGKRFGAMKEEDRPSKVLFVIITDGQENASREYNQKQVFDLIKHQQERYAWEFIYLGANQDAIQVAQQLGVRQGNALTFDATEAGAYAMVATMDCAVMSYRDSDSPVQVNLVDRSFYEKVKSERTAASDATHVGVTTDPKT